MVKVRKLIENKSEKFSEGRTSVTSALHEKKVVVVLKRVPT